MCSHDMSGHLAADDAVLSMNSDVVGAELSKALGLSVTALDSRGAQLTDYHLTTAEVDSSTLILSGTLALLKQFCRTLQSPNIEQIHAIFGSRPVLDVPCSPYLWWPLHNG